jgi:hypothetical protein
MKSCSETEKEAVEKHLLVCELCRVRLQKAEEWVALMKFAIPLGPKRHFLPSWHLIVGQIRQIGQSMTRPVVLTGCAALTIILCAAPLLLREQRASDEVVSLSATRGGNEQAIATASSHRRLILEPDISGLAGPLKLEVVDAAGAPLFSQPLPGGSPPRVRLDRRLKPGTYWVRINSAEAGHTNLRESGLRVQ